MKKNLFLLFMLIVPVSLVGAQEQAPAGLSERLLLLESRNRELSVHLRNVTADRQLVQNRLQSVIRDNERLRKKDAARRKELALLEKREVALQRRVRALGRAAKDAFVPAASAAEPTQNAALERENAGLHYNLGAVLQEKKRYDAAIKEFLLALRGNPDDKDAHYNLALIYDQERNDRVSALRHYRDYLRLAPDAADALRVRERAAELEAEAKVWGQPFSAGLDDREKLGRP